MSLLRESVKSVLHRISPGTLRSVRAPHIGLCNAEARDRWVRQALQALPANLRLLDAGAGEQPYRDACAHLRYVAQDFACYDGHGDGTGLQTGTWDQSRLDLVCDIAAIPEPDGSFDAILCTEVLEHVADPLAVLRGFSRLLRAGGTLILTAPFVSFTHFAPHHYHTGFSRYFYEHHLPLLGFEIRELSFNGNFFELIAQEARRLPWAAERYAGRTLTWRDRWIVGRYLRILGELGGSDQRSQELAAFGLHLVAVRRGARSP